MSLFDFFKKKQEKPEQRDVSVNYGLQTVFGLQLQDKEITPLALSAVYRAVTLISESLATLPFSIKLQDGAKSADLNTHPVNLIFRNLTDSNITFCELIRLLVQSVLLYGDGFAYIYRDGAGNAKKLRFLPWGSVVIEYDQIKDVLFYKCTNITKSRIEPKNMIHLKRFSRDGIHGISIVKSAWRTLQISSYSDISAKEYFSTGGSKKGYLKSARPITPEGKREAIDSWNNAYGKYGSSIAVLGNDFDFTQLNDSASDSQLLETRQFNVAEIARYFGISPILLGDLTHSSYSTIEAALIQFLSQTLNPWIVLMEQEFTRKLLKPSEAQLMINIDETSILLTDKVSMANYLKTLISAGILSINEARKSLDLSEIEGGNEHLIPYTDISQNKLGETDQQVENEEEDNENK